MTLRGYPLVLVLLLLAACGPGPVAPPPPEDFTWPSVVPSAPGAVRAEAEVGGATLTWSAPAQTGDSALTGYDVSGYLVADSREVPVRATIEGTTARVTGLGAGSIYRFRVRARNEAGTGEPGISEAVTLPDVPGAPRDVAVKRGDRQVEVTWREPEQDGGRPVLGYVITAQPQDTEVRVGATARSLVVGGLTNGVESTWSVRALNAVGEGYHVGSASGVPAALPSAPGGVEMTMGVRRATVTWSEPVDTGGLPVSLYVVTLEPGGWGYYAGPSERSVTFSGLFNATEYTPHVVALTGAGEGPVASGTPRRTPDVPRAPSSVKAVREVRAVKVSWEAPAEDGGSPITGYTVEVRPTGRTVDVAAQAREVTLTELPSTQAYTATVYARNGAGNGVRLLASHPVRPLPAPARVPALAVPVTSAGCVSLAYTLEQVDAERADVLVEVDARGDGTFRPATQAGSATHEGTLARTSSSAGTEHHFLWNRTRDVPGAATVQVRVSARVAGAARESRTVAVSLPAPQQRCDPSLDSSRVSTLPAYDPLLATPGDFDGDGKLDLVVTLEQGGRLALMKGLGNGAFEAGPLIAVSALSPSFRTPPVAADLNADGALDLLWTKGDHQFLWVMHGQGDGSFGTLRSYATGYDRNTEWSRGLVVDDFDGDGSPDVALVGSGGKLGLFWGRGTSGVFGNFTPVHDVGLTGNVLASADLDADGYPDLVVASQHATTVLLSNADRTFRTQPPGGVAGVHELLLGDFTGEGHVDLVTTRGTSQSVVLSLQRGDGRGGFSAPVEVATLPSGSSFFAHDPARAADLDGDGRLDLAVVSGEHDTLTLLRGGGDGTFTVGTRLPSGAHPFFVFTADLDADGVPEVATLERFSNNLRVWRGGPGRLEQPLRAAPGGALATGDLNGDGWKDVVTALTSPARVRVSLGGPQGLTDLAPIAVRNDVLGLQVARVDADTAPDVVVRYAVDGDTVGLLLGHGDGTLRLAPEPSVGAVAFEAAHGDVNGDGALDLVFTTRRVEDGVPLWQVRLLPGQGDGTFGAPRILDAGGRPSQVLLEDVTGDGALDLLVLRTGQGQGARVFPGQGDGTFAAGRSLGLGADFSGHRLALADMDQDGLLDVVFSGFLTSTEHAVFVMKGSGQGRFTHVGSYPTGGKCVAMTLVDFDADGGRDVVCANEVADSVSLLRGASGGVLQPARLFGTQTYATSQLEVLDANGDGLLDVFSGSTQGGNVLLLQQ